MMIRLAPVAAVALLSACGDPAPAPSRTVAVEKGYIAKVRALTPRQRDVMLFGAIQKGGGQACQGVKQVETLPPAKNGNPIWRITCDEGSQWAVALGDDGTAIVTGARTPS